MSSNVIDLNELFQGALLTRDATRVVEFAEAIITLQELIETGSPQRIAGMLNREGLENIARSLEQAAAFLRRAAVTQPSALAIDEEL